MKIGLGCTTLLSQASQERAGGLSTYTKNLLTCYQQQPDISVTPCYFKPLSAKLFPGSYARQIEKQIDLFHATDYLIPKFNHIPVIATIHDAAPLKYPHWCNPKLRRLKNWLLKQSIKHVDHVIADSKAMIPDLVRYWGIPEKNISVAYLGVEASWFVPRSDQEKAAVLSKYQLKPDFILFAGSFQARKNLDNVIDAYTKLPENIQSKHPLLLIGECPWKNILLEKKMQELKHTGPARVLSFIPRDELQTLFQCAKMLVFPSLYEGFGLPILEAFASKIPVITSNLFACPEIASDAALVINPYSIEAITQAMSTIIADTDLCKIYIEKGYARAKQMSWEACATTIISIYRSLLRKGVSQKGFRTSNTRFC